MQEVTQILQIVRMKMMNYLKTSGLKRFMKLMTGIATVKMKAVNVVINHT